MSEVINVSGKKIYYEYDEVQDMLYVTFAPSVGGTYYRDVGELDGVMLRYDGHTDELVGITVHNVKRKLNRWLAEDLYQRFVAPRAIGEKLSVAIS
jgi:hypothetical protein